MAVVKGTTFGTQIIKTIEDDDDVERYSEESEAEIEYQPSKHKRKNVDFDDEFNFLITAEEYNSNTWNDLNKYIKRKATSKVDHKIEKARSQEEEEDIEIDDPNQSILPDYNSDVSLSSEDLKHDCIKLKEKRKKQINKTITNNGSLENNNSNLNFYQMNLSRPLLKAITQMKFIHPTPIQAATIPVALMGKDIYGCAATGTGKTAAYMLPTLERLLYCPDTATATTRVLVLVPTRELGVQVYQVTKQLCQFTDIQTALSVGGLDLKTQENILRQNPDIVIATPGRLIDHLHGTPTFNLSSIEVLILDEADRMLDEYFAEQMKEIIRQCSRTRQTMLFSATLTDEVENLVSLSLNEPEHLFVDDNKNVAYNLRQEFIRIRSNREGDREPILAALVCRTFHDHCIIFVQTKKQAHRLHIMLGLLGKKVAELHGNLTQPQRLDTLQRFKDEQVDIVVATDVAARGLDIVGVKTVVNFIMPATMEHYIHRVGRTARAGRVGVSVSLVGEVERKIVKEIIKHANRSVKSRIIAVDIIEKYRTKLTNLESKIEQILNEEYQEKLMQKAENQLQRTKNLLDGQVATPRPWFQSLKEQKLEKKKLSIKAKPKIKEGKEKDNKGAVNGQKKRRNKTKETPDDRIQMELNKVSLLQARMAKRKAKPKKIQVCTDGKTHAKNNNRKKSNFTNDLCDTTVRNAKKLRYESKLKPVKSKHKKNAKKGGKPSTYKKRAK